MNDNVYYLRGYKHGKRRARLEIVLILIFAVYFSIVFVGKASKPSSCSSVEEKQK